MTNLLKVSQIGLSYDETLATNLSITLYHKTNDESLSRNIIDNILIGN